MLHSTTVGSIWVLNNWPPILKCQNIHFYTDSFKIAHGGQKWPPVRLRTFFEKEKVMNMNSLNICSVFESISIWTSETASPTLYLVSTLSSLFSFEPLYQSKSNLRSLALFNAKWWCCFAEHFINRDSNDAFLPFWWKKSRNPSIFFSVARK